jgi:guanosine-3',5'-bis(diphosphate) 3'-pyrophosphohydrolase
MYNNIIGVTLQGAITVQMLSNMIRLATLFHDGQFDKGGWPYILHPLTVMHRLRSNDEELNCIAVGHDLIEDTAVNEAMLFGYSFTSRVIFGIKGLTKMKDETEDAYYEHICGNIDMMLVKEQDLRHNIDIRRLKGITEKDIRRMANYHKRWEQIKEAKKKFA